MNKPTPEPIGITELMALLCAKRNEIMTAPGIVGLRVRDVSASDRMHATAVGCRLVECVTTGEVYVEIDIDAWVTV